MCETCPWIRKYTPPLGPHRKGWFDDWEWCKFRSTLEQAMKEARSG